jgi:acetylornithine/succinyldiaminopimelate/putrescine aminotransferase
MTAAFSIASQAPVHRHADVRPSLAAVHLNPLDSSARVRLHDDDSLLEFVNRNMMETAFGALFEREMQEAARLAGVGQLMTRNLRNNAAPIIWASGNYFVDGRGRMFLDFCSQTQNLNFGHNHPYLLGAAIRYLGSTQPAYTSSKFGNVASMRLVSRLSELLPAELACINLKLLNGADAVETALKSALKYHAANAARRKIVSLRWAHHGHSIGTMSCSNKYTHLPYTRSENHVYIDANDSGQLRAALTEDVAAFIVEPLQMNGGCVELTREYLLEARELCTGLDIALIFDEIQTAFGWLGSMFGFERSGVVPDILCLSKSLASGFPLAAAIMREKFDTLEFGEAEFTGGLNPLSAIVALANIELLTTTPVMHSVTAAEKRLATGLARLRQAYPSLVAEVRGAGLMHGLETVSHRVARQVYDFAFERGVLLRISKDAKGETVLFKPSLIVTIRQIDKLLEVLDHAFASIT